MEKDKIMKKVAVLLSTYNGSKFLREQLDSLVAQEGVEVILVARDDGSTKDNTIEILKSYKDKFSSFILLEEPNCGAEESFNRLCSYAINNTSTDFYAFCDQDDVWMPNKLYTAISKLSILDPQTPNLYYSNLEVVDGNLHHLGYQYKDGEVYNSKDKALVQIFTYGCTAVFNRVALEKYCGIYMNKAYHENWLYVLCSFLGHTIYDNQSYIKYRRHDLNLSLAKGSSYSNNYRRFKELFRPHGVGTIEILANQLYYYKDEMTEEDIQYLKTIIGYRTNLIYKLKLFFSVRQSMPSVIKTLCIKYRILTNCL